MKGLKEVIIKHGVFCSLYTDRGSHFFYTPKEGGAVDRRQLTQIDGRCNSWGSNIFRAIAPRDVGE